MLVIGLCGGSGAGKGAVGALLAERGIPVIDTDAVWHSLTERGGLCVDELANAFGGAVVNECGGLDRAALAAIVFADAPGAAERRALLERISHAAILGRTRLLLARYELEGAPAAAVDAPLLYTSGFADECDIVLRVDAPVELRIRRIIARDGITCEAAMRRIAAQSDEERMARVAAHVIVNDGDRDALAAATERFIAENIIKNSPEER